MEQTTLNNSFNFDRSGGKLQLLLEKQQKEINSILETQSDGKLFNVFAVREINGVQRYSCLLCSFINLDGHNFVSHTKSKNHHRLLSSIITRTALSRIIQKSDGKVNSQLQGHLNQIKAQGIIGMEYVIEIHMGENFESKFSCVLCERKFDLKMIIDHLTTYLHRVKYLKKHFPTTFEEISKLENREKKHHILEMICHRIELKHGRPSVLVVENGEYSKNTMKFIEEAFNSKHIDESVGCTFTKIFKEIGSADSLSSEDDSDSSSCSCSTSFSGESLKSHSARHAEIKCDVTAVGSTDGRNSYPNAKEGQWNAIMESQKCDIKTICETSIKRETQNLNESDDLPDTSIVKELNESDNSNIFGKLLLNKSANNEHQNQFKHKIEDESKTQRILRSPNKQHTNQKKSVSPRNSRSHKKRSRSPQRTFKRSSQKTRKLSPSTKSLKDDTSPVTYCCKGEPHKSTSPSYSPLKFSTTPQLNESCHTSIKSPDPETDEPITLLSVLSLLTAFEDMLGSFGPKVMDMMAKAIKMEKENTNSANQLLADDDNCTILEMIKEKLKGNLSAGIVEPNKIQGVKKSIKNLTALIDDVSSRKKANKFPSIPNANSQVDKIKISQDVYSSSATDKDWPAIIAKMLSSLIEKQTPAKSSEFQEQYSAGRYMNMKNVRQDNVIDEMKCSAASLVTTLHQQPEELIFQPSLDTTNIENRGEMSQHGVKDIESTLYEPSSKVPKNNRSSSTLNKHSPTILSDSELRTLIKKFAILSDIEKQSVNKYIKELKKNYPERLKLFEDLLFNDSL